MNPDLSPSRTRAERLTPLGPLLLLAGAGFAYRPLLSGAKRIPSDLEIEHWFFTTEQGAPLLALAIGGFLLWRRWARLLALPSRSAAAGATGLLCAGVGLFVWGQLTGVAELLLPSLAANLLALAAATRGRAGLRAVLLPAVVFLFGVPLPAPLRHELVWQLQNGTAHGAAWLLQMAGLEIELSGLVLRRGLYTFTVIETCSGLRAIQILTLLAVTIRELFAGSGRRPWLLLPIAPALAFGLNVLRVAAIVWTTTSADPAAFEPETADDTGQGMAVLVAGTLVLYALGLRLRGAGADATAGGGRSNAEAHGGRPLRAAALGLLVLAALSVSLPRLPRTLQPPLSVELPRSHRGWTGEDLEPVRWYVGHVPSGQVVHRRYQRSARDGPPHSVELFVALEGRYNPSLLSPKIERPGAAWSLDETRRTRVWMLGLDAALALASRDRERALVYSWRLRDDGFLRETLRSLLALDIGPLRRERRRAVVRLSTPLRRDGPVARNRAKQTLDRFIGDFGEALAKL